MCHSVPYTVQLNYVFNVAVFFFRTLLRNVCQGYNKAIMTQENTPVGAQIVYDGAKGNISVTSDSFNTLAKVIWAFVVYL